MSGFSIQSLSRNFANPPYLLYHIFVKHRENFPSQVLVSRLKKKQLENFVFFQKTSFTKCWQIECKIEYIFVLFHKNMLLN